MSTENPLGLKKIHHVEFYVGNAKQAEFYYRKAFGFNRIAYSGLETGNPVTPRTSGRRKIDTPRATRGIHPLGPFNAPVLS